MAPFLPPGDNPPLWRFHDPRNPSYTVRLPDGQKVDFQSGDPDRCYVRGQFWERYSKAKGGRLERFNTTQHVKLAYREVLGAWVKPENIQHKAEQAADLVQIVRQVLNSREKPQEVPATASAAPTESRIKKTK